MDAFASKTNDTLNVLGSQREEVCLKLDAEGVPVESLGSSMWMTCPLLSSSAFVLVFYTRLGIPLLFISL